MKFPTDKENLVSKNQSTFPSPFQNKNYSKISIKLYINKNIVVKYKQDIMKSVTESKTITKKNIAIKIVTPLKILSF